MTTKQAGLKRANEPSLLWRTWSWTSFGIHSD